MLSDKQIKSNLKQWGFESSHKDVGKKINAYVEKYMKKCADGKCSQSGGISQSSEWYGVDSGRYSADASPGSSLAVTQDYIRPPLEVHDPSGVIVGGGSKSFKVSLKSVTEASKSLSLSSTQRKQVKSGLEQKLTKALNSASKKSSSSHLSLASCEKALKQL